MYKNLILVVLCASVCIATSFLGQEEIIQDYLEHVLQIPNYGNDKIDNSNFQHSRLEQTTNERVSEEENCSDPSENLTEYTESLEVPQERGSRQLGAPKHAPICHLERNIRKLNTNEYEYRPAYYEEVKCSSMMENTNNARPYKEICTSIGFSCVQWNKTLHLTRRRYSSECWETRTMVIPAGCECMWPAHELGHMPLHM